MKEIGFRCRLQEVQKGSWSLSVQLLYLFKWAVFKAISFQMRFKAKSSWRMGVQCYIFWRKAKLLNQFEQKAEKLNLLKMSRNAISFWKVDEEFFLWLDEVTFLTIWTSLWWILWLWYAVSFLHICLTHLFLGNIWVYISSSLSCITPRPWGSESLLGCMHSYFLMLSTLVWMSLLCIKWNELLLIHVSIFDNDDVVSIMSFMLVFYLNNRSLFSFLYWRNMLSWCVITLWRLFECG